jgi:hypothetical protein
MVVSLRYNSTHRSAYCSFTSETTTRITLTLRVFVSSDFVHAFGVAARSYVEDGRMSLSHVTRTRTTRSRTIAFPQWIYMLDDMYSTVVLSFTTSNKSFYV